MTAKQEFLERELSWVRLVRKTRRPDQLHLVVPAVEREREILRELSVIAAEGTGASPLPFAANFSARTDDPGAVEEKQP
jgi:hypothetical protein